MQDFQVRQRYAASGARVAALSSKIIFSKGMHALSKRWNTCMEHKGDYIEI